MSQWVCPGADYTLRESASTRWNGRAVNKVLGRLRSSRDSIVRTDRWAEAILFYETVLGFAAVYHSESLVDFETGALGLYIEKGAPYEPVLVFLTQT
jgi:hypothetical protein